MGRLPGLYVRMVRLRVAAMLWMFLLLAGGLHGSLNRFRWGFVLAALALASSYVAATTVNDVADEAIDRVNHPVDRGRPLVTGEATTRDLLVLHWISGSLAVLAALPLGPLGALLVLASLGIGRAYSLPPIRLSYRTYLAPLALSVAYVLIPFGLGLVASRAVPGADDVLFAGALLALFLARICLKDFRDVLGDARYGRPTLLLRFGKTITCGVSLAALGLGNALWMISLLPPLPVAVVLQSFVLAVVSRLRALWFSADPRTEQLAIGVGARMGNGLLLTTLAWLMVRTAGATSMEQSVVALVLAAPFWLGYQGLVSRPEEAVIVYKG